MKPTPFQVFCGYYLGLDRDLKYHFFNLAALARHYEIAPDELRALLEQYDLTPEVTRHVDYNLAKAHANAQDIAGFGGSEDIVSFARRTFDEFMAARGWTYDERRDFENIDYERILPDPPRKDGPDEPLD
ncbi:MAG: hypothetical protein FJ087_13440 [Deltaproteobacteria bacterium]|nr:hypothetical protein [Deltaproteobacteria bacterium]